MHHGIDVNAQVRPDVQAGTSYGQGGGGYTTPNRGYGAASGGYGAANGTGAYAAPVQANSYGAANGTSYGGREWQQTNVPPCVFLFEKLHKHAAATHMFGQHHTAS